MWFSILGDVAGKVELFDRRWASSTFLEGLAVTYYISERPMILVTGRGKKIDDSCSYAEGD